MPLAVAARMRINDHIAGAFRREFTDWRQWWSRAVVIAAAARA
jgi:hypothetical protein